MYPDSSQKTGSILREPGYEAKRCSLYVTEHSREERLLYPRKSQYCFGIVHEPAISYLTTMHVAITKGVAYAGLAYDIRIVQKMVLNLPQRPSITLVVA